MYESHLGIWDAYWKKRKKKKKEKKKKHLFSIFKIWNIEEIKVESGCDNLFDRLERYFHRRLTVNEVHDSYEYLYVYIYVCIHIYVYL